MKDAVVIKSYQNGITLLLNEEIPFEDILREIELKFIESKAFFGNSRMALSFEGRELTRSEEIRILEVIKGCSDVNIICIIGKDPETDLNFVRAMRQVEQKLSGGGEGQFYKGTLKNGDRLETETSIIILGDVLSGCEVSSARNIIVLGRLYGEAYAGIDGREGHYVVALEMAPEKLRVGDFRYTDSYKQKKGGERQKVQPKIAYVKNESVVVEPLTKELQDCF